MTIKKRIITHERSISFLIDRSIFFFLYFYQMYSRFFSKIEIGNKMKPLQIPFSFIYNLDYLLLLVVKLKLVPFAQDFKIEVYQVFLTSAWSKSKGKQKGGEKMSLTTSFSPPFSLREITSRKQRRRVVLANFVSSL